MKFKYWNDFIGYDKPYMYKYHNLDITYDMITSSIRQIGRTNIFTQFLNYLNENNLKLEIRR